MATPRIHCVAVGIDQYPLHPKAATLRGAVNDCEQILETILRSHPDSVVRLIANKDATAKNILNAVTEVSRQIKRNDLFIFTFAGHGGSVESPKEKNSHDAVLVTADFSEEHGLLQYREQPGGITLNDIAEIMNRSKCNNALVLLDCCQAGTGITNTPGQYAADQIPSRGVRTIPGIQRSDAAEYDPPIYTRVPWNVAHQCIIAATDGLEDAHELVKEQHGALTWAFLRWWEEQFMGTESTEPVQANNLSAELRDRIALLRGDSIPEDASQPNQILRGNLQIPRSESSAHTDRSSSYWQSGRAGATRTQSVDARHFTYHLQQIVKLATDNPKGVVSFSNLVVTAPTLSGIRDLMAEAAERIAQKLANANVCQLGWGPMQNIFPMDSTIVGNNKTIANLTAMSPIARERRAKLIANLEDRNSVLIVPYFPDCVSEETESLLEDCAANPRIRLVLIVNETQPYVPQYLRKQHFRRLDIPNCPRDSYQSISEKVNLESLDRHGLLNWRMVRWLDVVGRTELSSQELLPVRPEVNERNPTRVCLNLLQSVLGKLRNEHPEAFTLLRAFCVADLPRSRNMALAILENLAEANMLERPDIQLDECINRLQEFGLLDDSKWEPPRWLVHHLVKDAIAEFPQSEADVRERRLMVAMVANIYREATKNGGRGVQWPLAITAFQSIHLFISVGELDEAAKTLITSWKALISDGYHIQAAEWADYLRGKLKSAKLEIQLLLRIQSLNIHMQRWQIAIGLGQELERSVDAYKKRHGSTPAPAMDLARWESRRHTGTALLASGEYELATEAYNHCLQWIGDEFRPTMSHLRLESACRNRLVELAALTGAVDEGTTRLADARECIERMNDPAQSHRAELQLDSYEIQLARIREDQDRLYALAVKSWHRSLASRQADANLSTAIARIHMGWAALLRGEYARAFRHGRAARLLFDKRGVPEDWWIGMAQQVIGLALAWTYRERNNTGLILCPHPSLEYPKTPAERKDLIPNLEKEVRAEIVELRNLISRCSAPAAANPRRECELRSALGQLLCYSKIDDQAGLEELDIALRVAYDSDNLVMQVYLYENMACLVQDHEVAPLHAEAAVARSKGELTDGNQRRMANYKKITKEEYRNESSP